MLIARLVLALVAEVYTERLTKTLDGSDFSWKHPPPLRQQPSAAPAATPIRLDRRGPQPGSIGGRESSSPGRPAELIAP